MSIARAFKRWMRCTFTTPGAQVWLLRGAPDGTGGAEADRRVGNMAPGDGFARRPPSRAARGSPAAARARTNRPGLRIRGLRGGDPRLIVVSALLRAERLGRSALGDRVESDRQRSSGVGSPVIRHG